jgi:hypothetical protein
MADVRMNAIRMAESPQVTAPKTIIINPEVIKILQDTSRQPAPAPPAPVEPPRRLEPQLFLVEHYQLSTFRGDLFRDELVATLPPLRPHTELTFKLITQRKTSLEIAQSSTVLDSQTTQNASSFNQNVQNSSDAKFGKDHYDYGMQGNFHGEGSVGFGSASADAHVDVAGSTNDVRQEFANSVSSGIDSQVSQANQARREQVTVGSQDTKIDEQTQTETVQITKNETDQVENDGIFQIKEEFIAILSLVDVEVAFLNTNPQDHKSVPLFKLDSLLEEVIEDSKERDSIRTQIRKTLENVRDVRDELKSIVTQDSTQPNSFVVNKRLESTHELKNSDGSVRRVFSVPGIILNVYRRFIKKPGVTVVLPIN